MSAAREALYARAEPRGLVGLSGGTLLSEIVELMLEGMVCEECGVLLEDAVGHPRRCTACDDVQAQGKCAGEEDTGEDSPFD